MATNRRKRGGQGGRSGPPEDPTAGSARRAPAETGPTGQADYYSVVKQAMRSDAASARFERIRARENAEFIHRNRARADDAIRILRNLAFLTAFSLGTLSLVTYAGILMGIHPAACVTGGVSGAALLVRTFTRAFESVRSAQPDAPEGPPSSDAP
ncbi:hypothetical protein AB0O07_16715 [Streptomyces sp. NPDC093085]|uniref:hypothetical protein n=1 Tax=Streptomyces sp. NPDC093085 TaxID=3155068 RepID=UPI0034174B43